MEPSKDYVILDNLLEGCQIISFEYSYLYVNDAVVRHGRRNREELLGNTMMSVYPGIENTPVFGFIEQCMEARTPAELENEFIYPDGRNAWFALKIEPVPEGVFILSVDITDRKQVEMELNAHLIRLKALREIDRAILNTTDLNFALHKVLEQITSSLEVDAADILLLEPNSLILKFSAGRGFRTRGVESTRLRIGQGHAGKAALTLAMVSIPDLSNPDEPFLRSDLITDEDFVSFFALPLVSKGNLVGVLEIFHRDRLDPEPGWLDFLQSLGGQASIAIDSGQLLEELQRSNLNLRLSYDMTIEGWSRAMDLRDHDTEGHTLRVTEVTVDLAELAGIPMEEIVHIRRGALLHDIGKIGVPDSILHKPGKLTEEEWEIMRRHPSFAYHFLYPIDYLRPSLSIPHSHHEKWDGTGYPQGLKGDQIPLSARLFAVVDVWDALSSDRPYRKAWPRDKVLEYIREQSGRHFDPQVVQRFLKMVAEKGM